MIAVLAQAQGQSGYLGFQESMDLGPVYAVAAGLIVVIAGVVIVRRLVGRGRAGARTRGSAEGRRKQRAASRRDQLREFSLSVVDVDALVSPPSGRARPIPEELGAGTVLVSQRLGIKCLLLEDLTEVGRQKLKEVCARKLKANQGVYLPMGTQVFRDEILHQGREFTAKLRKGTLFVSAGGHPNAYLLDELKLPLRRELTSNPQVLVITDATAQRYLQALVDIPISFELLKEDVLFDASPENVRKAVEMIAGGSLQGDRLASHTVGLDDIHRAFELMQRGEALRVVLEP